jgi:hypothetical protein
VLDSPTYSPTIYPGQFLLVSLIESLLAQPNEHRVAAGKSALDLFHAESIVAEFLPFFARSRKTPVESVVTDTAECCYPFEGVPFAGKLDDLGLIDSFARPGHHNEPTLFTASSIARFATALFSLAFTFAGAIS